MTWSSTYLPSTPLFPPKPLGLVGERLLSNNWTLLKLDAHTNTVRAAMRRRVRDLTSMTRTAETRRLPASYSRDSTMVSVSTVRFPVALAAGRVDDCVLK